MSSAGYRNLFFHSFLILLFSMCAHVTAQNRRGAASILINEVDADMAGDETTEFIELYDGGSGNTSLTGMVVVLFNGNGDTSYEPVFDLDGLTTDANGFFLIGGAGIAGIDDRVTANTGVKVDTAFWLQNGADAVALYTGDATDFPAGTAATTTNLIDALVYDTADSDDAGLLILLNAGQPQVDERGGGNGDLHSNARVPDGGTARNTDTYTQQEPTPGSTNSPVTIPTVFINETDADTPGTDVAEFIELYDGGAGNTALDGLVVVLFNGSDDQSYEPAFDLDGLHTDANGFFLIAAEAVPGIADRVTAGTGLLAPPSNWLQNGADAVALFVGDATSWPEDTAITTDNLIDAIVYDTADSDDAGLLVLLNAGQPQVDERGAGAGDQHANARIPDGGTLRNTDTFVQQEPTPGYTNIIPDPVVVVINETDADTPGTDVAEFIELYDGGVGNTALDGLVVVLFNGSDDQSYEPAFDLDGLHTDANGFFLIAAEAVPGIADRVTAGTGLLAPPSNWLQNGADAVALFTGDATSWPEDTPITTDNLLDAIVYDTADSDDAGLLVLLNAGQPQVDERGGGAGDQHANARIPDGGAARNTDTYVQQAPTPGFTNIIPDPVVFVINETDADTPGTDVAEFIEIYDGGVGNSPLDGLVVVLYNGSDDQSYEPAFDLDGLHTDANGFFLIASEGVADIADRVTAGTGLPAPPSNWLQNGADAVALYTGDATSFPNDTPLTTDNLLDAVVYDTADSDDAGLLVLLNADQPQVDERGGGDGNAHANARVPDGGTPRNTDTYTQQVPTPGTTNVPPVPTSIVINEFLADPATDDSGDANGDGTRDSSEDEFVELVNNGAAVLDLTDWTLSDSALVRHVFPAGTMVQPGTAIVVFGGGTPTGTFGGAVVQTASTGALGFSNGGDAIVLQNTMAEEIARVDYGGEAANDQSRTLDPDITGLAYVDHATVANSGGALFSPGNRTDGSPFLGGGTDSEPISIDCGGALTVPEGEAGQTTVTATDVDSTITNITVDSIDPMPAAGTISAVFTAADMTNPATATVTVTSDVPGGSYSVLMVATNDDATPQLSGCVLTVNVVAPVSIGAVQGDGLTSPLLGQAVSTSGIVTGVAPDGFAIQDPVGDGNNDTSDGIFVFTGSAPTVSVGDAVSIVAEVQEFFDFTQLGNASDITVTSSGNALPAPVMLNGKRPSPYAPQDPLEFERLEGMLVSVTGAMVNGGNQGFGSDPIAEVYVNAGGTRVFREPGILYPGLPKLPVWDGNPEMFEIDPNRMGLPNIMMTGGSTVDAVGIMGYEFGEYEIFPTALTVTNEVGYPRPVRAREAGEFTVGTQNMLRLFDDIPDNTSRADANPNALADNPDGAHDVLGATEYQMRLGKFSMAIRDVLGSPDILALQEVENIGVLNDLAAKIATDDATITYTAHLIEGNDIGGIDVGFLTRDNVTVDTLTQIQPTETFMFEGNEYTLHDRPPLLLEGSVTVPGGEPFAISVMAIHNRSLIDVDTSEFVRTKRHLQALRISQAVQELQVANPDIHLMLLGDFNAFQFTDGFVDALGQITGNPDPLGAMVPATDEVNPDLTNHTFNVPAEDRYSFIQGESAQVLDHILTSEKLTCNVTQVMFSRYNVDVAEVFEDDFTTPLRATDHEGAVAFIKAPRIVVDAPAELAVTEAGGADSLTVVLDTQPNADVTINVSSSNEAEGTVSPATLTFTSANWNTPQTVTLTGVNDDIADGSIGFQVQFDAAVSTNACYAGQMLPPIAAVNADDDVAGITVDPTSGLVTDETGNSDTFTVVLTSEPTADVTLPLSVDDTTEGSLDVSQLVFTAANWNTPQTVTVTGVDDDLVDGNVAYTIITGAAGSADAGYNGMNPANVAATNISKDSAEILVSTVGPLTTSETGTSASYTLVLTSEPTADVTVPVASDDLTEGVLDVAEVVFTAANWSTPQTVTVTGVDDDIVDGDVLYIIRNGPAVSADADYNGLSAPGVTVMNLSKDVAGVIQAGPTGAATSEDGSAVTFTLVLESQPIADVTIPVTVSDSTEGSVAPAELTFTAADWNVPQTVTISGVADGQIDGDQLYTVTWGPSSSADVNYQGATGSIAMTNININQEANYTINVAPGSLIFITGDDGLVGLYTFDPDTGEWTFLENVTITDGVGVSTIVAMPDTVYGLGAPDGLGAPTLPVASIPTLGEWGLIFFVLLLMSAALLHSRRQRLA